MPALVETPVLDELAIRQYGLVTRSQLLSFSIDDMAMCRRTKAGLWQRVLPAVYLTHSGPITLE